MGFFVSRYHVKVRGDIAISSLVVRLHHQLAYRWRYYSCCAFGTHSACPNAYAYKPIQCITSIHLMFAHKSTHNFKYILYV